MKKLLIALVLVSCILLAPFSAAAVDKQLTLRWEQTLSTNFYGWKVWRSETAGGPYTQFGEDIVYDGSPASSYSSTEVLTAVPGTTYYFVVNAWNTLGDSSGNSSEVSYSTLYVPVNLTIIVQTP